MASSAVAAAAEGGWEPKHEEILKEWKAKLFVQLWLQEESSYYYSRLCNWLSYPVIAMTSVSSAALFSSDNNIMKYAIGVLSLISGILVSISRQLKPGELNQQHAMTTRRYHSLIRTIDTCLSMPPGMRANAMVFIEKIGVDIDNLMENQVDPPMYVMNRFEAKYGPIDKMMYGEDIVELLKLEMQTNKIVRRLARQKDSNFQPSTEEASTPQGEKQLPV